MQFKACFRSSLECVAIMLIRRRLVPGGTVGGRIADTKIFLSINLSLKLTARSGCPRMMEIIGAAFSGTSKLAARSFARNQAVFARRVSLRCGSVRTISSAFNDTAIIAGDKAVEKIKLR